MSVKITSYPGREVTTDELKQGKYLELVQKFEPRYSWAAGVAISRFLNELKEGRIIARKCLSVLEPLSRLGCTVNSVSGPLTSGPM